MMSVRINLVDNSVNRAMCVMESTVRCQTMTAVTTIEAGVLMYLIIYFRSCIGYEII